MSASAGSPDLLIVGGGIVGLAVAEAAARRGLHPLVLDGGHAGAASHASAGMIAPLAEVPGNDPAERRFLDVCRRSRDLWQEWAGRLADATGLDLGYDREGALVIERDDALEAAAERAGEPHRRLHGEELRHLVPDLDPSIRTALHLPGEHRVDNRRVCRALLHRLRDAGVEVREGVTVERVERIGDGVRVHGRVEANALRLDAARVLVAAGAWTPRIDGLGPDLPIRPLRGQMLRLRGVPWPFTGSLRGEHFYAVRRGKGELLVGATEEDAGYDAHVTCGGLGRLVDWVRETLPGLADRPVVESWAGLRPTPPDGRPLLGPLDDSGTLWIAAGHHRNGILLTPWTAEVVAEWLAEGVAPAAEVRDLFEPRRFTAPVTGSPP